MNTKTQRTTQSFRRANDWRSTRDGILQAAPAPIHVHFDQLNAVVTRIETAAVTQVAQHALRTRTATDATLCRDAVRDAMRPITQVARTLQGKVLGIGSISMMPSSNWDNEKLVIAANSMVENATTFAKALVDHGLQPDCIETLKSAAAALKSSIDARGNAKATAVGARDGIRDGLKEGRKLVSLLDAGLSSFLKNDPANLASWKNAKRITLKSVVGTIVPASPTGNTPSVTTPANGAEGTTRAA